MGGLDHQLFRMGGATQEGEIRGNGKFDVTHGTYAGLLTLSWERVAAEGRGVRGPQGEREKERVAYHHHAKVP
jgi:hypothetical protein